MTGTTAPQFTVEIEPLGDRAVLVIVATAIDEKSFETVQQVLQVIEHSTVRGVIEIVPAFTTLAVYYDPLQTSYAKIVLDIRESLRRPPQEIRLSGRIVELPVCYGGPFGEDLSRVAEQCGLSCEEIIAIHSSQEYKVHMLGFVPGFPYLGGMSLRIATPRRATPRLKIPAGSVGIAGTQTGIYPLETPGGWQLIGRTPMKLFDPDTQPPTLLQAGDKVRFHPISPEEFAAIAHRVSSQVAS
jgi:inhibitor of KinA